jgi:hypothetical protein
MSHSHSAVIAQQCIAMHRTTQVDHQEQEETGNENQDPRFLDLWDARLPTVVLCGVLGSTENAKQPTFILA